jgi:hypothetical protein
MTSSRSNISRSSWLVVALVVLSATVAHADHKRIVVLDFEGPKAEKFHEAIVKAIEKKDNTVIGTDKWNGTAEELQATKLNKKNARKVAKRLKIDGIVSATIEKSDEGYVVHVKLRAGKSGAVVAEQIDLKSEGTKLSKKEINDALVGAIDGLEDNGGDSSAKDDAPAGDDDDSGPKHGAFSKTHDADTTGAAATDTKKDDKKDSKKDDKKDDTKTADSDPPPKTHHHKKDKDVAASGDDDSTSVTASVEPAAAPKGDEVLTPANRGVDFTIGMSFTARHLSYAYASSLSNAPPAYKEGVPVAGGIMDATVYPLAILHKSDSILTNLGIEVMYDKVIDISSKKGYIDMTTMSQQTASLATDEERFEVGGVFRYPVTPDIVPGIKLLYVNQQFEIAQTLPDGSSTDVPNVHYSAVEPNAFLHYSATPSLTIDADAAFMLLLKSGQITSDGTGYGQAKDYGLELTVGASYNITKAIFARAQLHIEEISLTFRGDQNSLSNTRDNMPMSQDVSSAKDLYLGGAISIGYAY